MPEIIIRPKTFPSTNPPELEPPLLEKAVPEEDS
jgi:hypothetical protein